MATRSLHYSQEPSKTLLQHGACWMLLSDAFFYLEPLEPRESYFSCSGSTIFEIPRGSRGPQFSRKQAKMVPEWVPEGSKMVPRSSPDGLRRPWGALGGLSLIFERFLTDF